MNLYVDLYKAIDKAKLVKRAVQVKGKNGKTFTRMQWVDPNSGQTVMEHSHEGVDEHAKTVRSMEPEHLKTAVDSYISKDKDKAVAFGEATGMKRAKYVTDHILSHHLVEHADKIPMDHITPHLKPFLPKEDDKPKDIQKHPLMFPSINVLQPDLPEADRNRMMGLDRFKREELTDGTKMWEADPESDFAKELEETAKSVLEDRPEDAPYSNTKELCQYLFHDLSIEGMSKAMTTEHYGVKANIDSISFYSGDHGKVGAVIEFGLSDKDGNDVGYAAREIERKHGRPELHIEHESFELDASQQGKGVGNEMYKSSDAVWKYLSKGHPVSINLTANISIGVYAWARKGYDFKHEEDIHNARLNLKRFCTGNNVNLDDVLKRNGYLSIKELNHSWQFANLEDGHDYDLKSAISSRYKFDVEGTGHLGKVFMLGGMGAWKGERRLNSNHHTEEISEQGGQ